MSVKKGPITIASAAGIAVTHREKDNRPGDFRVSDQIRAAMEKAAKESMEAGKSPEEVRAAIDKARKDTLGIE